MQMRHARSKIAESRHLKGFVIPSACRPNKMSDGAHLSKGPKLLKRIELRSKLAVSAARRLTLIFVTPGRKNA